MHTLHTIQTQAFRKSGKSHTKCTGQGLLLGGRINTKARESCH